MKKYHLSVKICPMYGVWYYEWNPFDITDVNISFIPYLTFKNSLL